MVLDRGLEPAIVRVRGGPPSQLEESSIRQAPNSSCREEEFTALTINLQPFSDPNNIGDRQPGADFIPVFSEDPEGCAYRLTEAFWVLGRDTGARTRISGLKGQCH